MPVFKSASVMRARTRVCVCVCVFVCVCVCVSVFMILRNIEMQRNIIETTPPSPSQDHDSDVSAPHGSTAKFLRTRVCSHARTRLRAQIHTRKHGTNKSRAIHQHAQTRLPRHLWILFRLLLVGMLPHSCNGAHANVYLASHKPCLIRCKR